LGFASIELPGSQKNLIKIGGVLVMLGQEGRKMEFIGRGYLAQFDIEESIFS